MAIDVKATDTRSFKAELNKYPNQQIIIDFWASWCGPCRAVTPLLHEIEQSDDSVTLLKVNVDDNSELSASLGIQSIPTLMFFKNGEQNAEPIIGVTPQEVIVSRYAS